MLNWLIEKTAGAVKEITNGVDTTLGYVTDEITGIPEAVEKGWEQGLFTKSEEETTSEETTLKDDIGDETEESTH